MPGRATAPSAVAAPGQFRLSVVLPPVTRTQAGYNNCLAICQACPSVNKMCVHNEQTMACCSAVQTCCTGACVNTNTDVSNCGACGRGCPQVPHATIGCAAGTCVILSCNNGFADCNHLYADGCETNILTDVNNCGACGRACGRPPNVASVACTAGACVIVSCNAGFADCDHVFSNGCETNINIDPRNCGACGRVCAPTQRCVNGQCV